MASLTTLTVKQIIVWDTVIFERQFVFEYQGMELGVYDFAKIDDPVKSDLVAEDNLCCACCNWHIPKKVDEFVTIDTGDRQTIEVFRCDEADSENSIYFGQIWA